MTQEARLPQSVRCGRASCLPILLSKAMRIKQLTLRQRGPDTQRAGSYAENPGRPRPVKQLKRFHTLRTAFPGAFLAQSKTPLWPQKLRITSPQAAKTTRGTH